MKVTQRTIMKILPGKMAEATKLLEKQAAVAGRLGGPPWICYRRFSGGGDNIHTLVFHADWNSLSTMEATLEKASGDPEMQELMAKWETILESQELELLMPLP